MLGSDQGKVVLVKLLFVDFTNQVVKELLGHDGLASQEMDTVVGAGEESGTAIIFHGIFFSLKFSHEGDGVVYTWGEGEKLLLEVTSRSLIVEVANSADKFPERSLVAAQIVGLIFATGSAGNVELSADAVLLPICTSSSLEFGYFIPDSRVLVSGEVRGGCRVLALACMCHFAHA